MYRLGGSGGAVARDVDWEGGGGWQAEEVVDIGRSKCDRGACHASLKCVLRWRIW